MKKLIAGNWKMNGTLETARALAGEVAAGISGNPGLLNSCDFLVCPPFIHIKPVLDTLQGKVAVGGQDCARAESGAYTGDVSAKMIKDIGCQYVILGHSECRQHKKETDESIAEKAKLAHKEGLIAVVCVGESEIERDAGQERAVVESQLLLSLPDSVTANNTVIAYEPVWAIGTGKTATPQDVEIMHKLIREKLASRFKDGASLRILYGGSVKPDNAKALMHVPNVDGALIGGASLKAADYLAIAAAAA